MFVDTLTHISTIETRQASYEFSLIAVYQDPNTAEFWWAADSGCSCPIPFDSVCSFADMLPLNDLTWNNLVHVVRTRDLGDGVDGAERLSWLRKLSAKIEEARANPLIPEVPNPFTEA
jgi:hypothetical protein